MRRLRESGLDAAALLARTQEPAVKDRSAQEHRSERSRAAPSAARPSSSASEIFFGKDRLRDVEEEIARATANNGGPVVWLAAGLRTPFVNVDGPFAERDSLGLSVPVVQAMARQVTGSIDLAVWGSVVVNLAYANLAREVWLEAKLDPHVPTFTTIMQCSTSMVGVFEAAGMLGRRAALAMVGGVESMTRVQIGLGPNFSVWLRRLFQARSAADRLRVLRRLRPRDIRLFVPEVKNRVTGRSMGEHTEDMAKDWNIGRREQDALALEGHQRAVAAQDRGFFADLIVPRRRRRQGPFPAPRYVDGKARQVQAGVRSNQRHAARSRPATARR